MRRKPTPVFSWRVLFLLAGFGVGWTALRPAVSAATSCSATSTEYRDYKFVSGELGDGTPISEGPRWVPDPFTLMALDDDSVTLDPRGEALVFSLTE